MRVETKDDQLAFEFFDPVLMGDVMRLEEPFEFRIPTDATSQPYVPLRAAGALVKIACSICPKELLSECQPAIDC
jgi:hypothetical protein